MEIEYKQKISRPMNCRNCFYPFTGNPAIIPKNLSVRCTIPHELFLRGMVIKLVGLVRALDDGETVAFLHYLLVDPAYQGQYIGDELMKRIMSFYQNLLYVKVMPSDPKTIPFYERYSFQQYDNYSAMVRKHFL